MMLKPVARAVASLQGEEAVVETIAPRCESFYGRRLS